MNLDNPKLIHGYRGAVETWECDQMDHMNVQFYASKSTASLSHLLNALGLSPARIREEGKSLRYQNLRIQYKAEMRVGALGQGVSGIRAVLDNSIIAFTHLFDVQTGILSSVSEYELAYEDLLTGEKLDLPEFVKEAARKLEDEHESMYKPTEFKAEVITPNAMDHTFETSRTAVDVWECDAWHNIETRHIIGRVSDAASSIMRTVGISRAMQKERNLGSAALDSYMEFHRPIKMANTVVLKSGLMDRKPKNFIFGHQMFNSDTGEVVNTMTVLGCYFHMKERKSVPLPDEFNQIPEENLLKHQIQKNAAE